MHKFKLYFTAFLFVNIQSFSQDMLETYQRAEQFMAGNVSKIVYNENVIPHFLANSSKFWYLNESEAGHEYYLVNPEKKTNKLAFNHKTLSKKLSEKQGKEINPYQLDLNDLLIKPDEKVLTFSFEDEKWEYSLQNKELTVVNKDESLKETETESPDKKWIAFIQDFNIWLKNVETGDTVKLSTDGIDKYDYGASLSWDAVNKVSEKSKYKPQIIVYWSPDSRKLIVPRYDRRYSKKLYMLNSTPDNDFRPEVFAYERPVAGDSLVTTIEYVLFDIESKKQINLNISPNATFLNNSIEWLPSSMKAYLIKYSRGYKSRKLIEINARTGEVNMIHTENCPTYVDQLNHSFLLLEEVGLFLWTSEKTGWNHIYIHDLETGSLVSQVTHGD